MEGSLWLDKLPQTLLISGALPVSIHRTGLEQDSLPAFWLLLRESRRWRAVEIHHVTGGSEIEGGSVLPVAWSLGLRRIQDRIASSNERIEPVRLGPGPLDPLLLLEGELAVFAGSVLDGSDVLAQPV